MEKIVVDFAVIGSGPAGQKAAIQAAKLGKSVVIIEKGICPGGNCLNSGTIPSKSLREAILDLTRYNERSFYGASCLREVTINDLNYRLNTVLEAERTVLLRQFKKNNIRYIQGAARFLGPNQLQVDNNYHITAQKFLLATGSEPRNPMHIPFDNEVVLDSNRLLTIGQIPRTMIVLGGGVIGSEYASFFAALGCKVTVIDKRDRLLSSLDAEIGTHLQVGLKENGLDFVPRKSVKSVQRIGDKAHLICTDGTTFEADVLLYALGREANVQGLGLETINLAISEQGYIPVNEFFQTKLPHIYAAGDVIGFPALASTSMEQGRLAAAMHLILRYVSSLHFFR